MGMIQSFNKAGGTYSNQEALKRLNEFMTNIRPQEQEGGSHYRRVRIFTRVSTVENKVIKTDETTEIAQSW
jgi:hypothetical protein